VAGQSEGVCDPAIGVDHVSVDGTVADAADGVADQIVGGDDDTAEEQDGRGHSVVHAENGVVDHCLVDQVANLDESGHRRRQPNHCHLALRSLKVKVIGLVF